MKKIKILMVAAEVTPLAKVGGLADVVGALPKALVSIGQDVRIVMPYYGFLKKTRTFTSRHLFDYKVLINGKKESVKLFEAYLPGTKVIIYLIKHKYFDGQRVYNGNEIQVQASYKRQDDLTRFAFFSKAVLESLKSLNWMPDILHCHDWHSAIIPYLIKEHYSSESHLRTIKTLYTIHNLAMQGKADSRIKNFLEIPNQAKIDPFNFMVQGVANCNLINTVSPTYAKEILTKEQGAGLEKLLKNRKKDLFGILNGIDMETFNPETDKSLKKNFNVGSLLKKGANKQVLQQQLGLKQGFRVALVGLISRFVSQKGIELITEKFANLNCQFVFLGTGQPEFENQLRKLSQKFPDKFSTQIKFDVELAQQIYGGADIFLMPSKFEPCGLGQMIAMRYGTIPVVRATGGLADTVDSSVGFSFKPYQSDVLYKTLEQALKVYYNDPKTWKKLQKNAMVRDFSWNKPAKEYKKLYKKLANIK